MLSFFWTYLLPSTGVGLLIALLWSQRRVRVLGVELVQAGVQIKETKYQLALATVDLARMQKAVDEWKYAAVEATKKFNQAKAEAEASQDRFNALTIKIKDQPVPGDAEGALEWLAAIARDLAQEVRP